MVMAKKQIVPKKATKPRSKPETDSTYFLKLVMYFIFGTLWVHIDGNGWVVPIPLGFIVGMAFATHEHFKIDRKIEYAVLVVAMFLSYFLAPGLVIAV